MAEAAEETQEPKEDSDDEISEVSKRNIDEMVRHYLDTVRVQGLSAFQQVVQNELDGWKTIKFNIALVGQSGSGKSALINAILGLAAEDENAAAVGVTETTMKVKMYCHPKRPNLVLWDLPGVDTPNFPKEQYWVKMEKDMSDFDFLLLVSAGSFKDSDIWFAKDILGRNRNFYFVKTQVDLDVLKDKMAYPNTYKNRNVEDLVRRNIIKQLSDGQVLQSSENIFLVNCFDSNAFDFQSMIDAFIKQAPEVKRQAFILSLTAGAKTVIDEKVKILEARIPKIAIFVSLTSAIPIPVTGLAAEIGAIYREAKLYREQFGIDEASLNKMSQRMGIDVDTLKNKMGMKKPLMFVSVVEFGKAMSFLATSKGVETMAKYSAPILGSLIAGAISFPVCYYMLTHALKICKTEASNAQQVINDWLYESYEADEDQT